MQGNVFFNGPRAGININDGFGGGNQIQNNLLFNFVRGKNFRLHWIVKKRKILTEAAHCKLMWDHSVRTQIFRKTNI